MRSFLVLMVIALCACQSPVVETVPSPEEGARFQTTLTSSQEFEALANGGDVNVLLALDPSRESVFHAGAYFIDVSAHNGHLEFVQSFAPYASMTEAVYEAKVLPPQTRSWLAGFLSARPDLPHPSGDMGVLGFRLHTAWGVSPTPTEVYTAWERLREQAPYAADRLVWLVSLPTERAVMAEVRSLGVPVLDLEQVTVPAEAYSVGVNYGYLQIDPDLSGHYTSRDILVTQSAPNNLGVVGGLLVSLPGSSHSHISMRMRDRGWPSGYLPDVLSDAYLAELEGGLIRLEVRQDGVVFYGPATLEEAESHWADMQPDLPDLVADLGVMELRSFAAITPDDASSCGVKAANLGGIHAALSSDTAGRVEGFCIPFAWYAEHIQEHGLGPLIKEVLNDPAVWQDGDVQDDRLDDVRDAIRDAPVSAALLDAVLLQIEQQFDDPYTTRFRFRSSTNAEDLPGVSGAGLYKSKSGCLGDDLDGDDEGPSHCLSQEEQVFLEERLVQYQMQHESDPQPWLARRIKAIQKDLTKEKPVAEAIAKVFASTWTARAFQDRAHYGIDHTRVYMGIAVNPSFVLEEAEAVLITNPETGVHAIESQVSDVGVVRPDVPGATVEVATLSWDGTYDVLSESNMTSGPIWAPDEVQRLADRIELVSTWFAQVYGPDVLLDIEVECMAGEPVIKQARPAN